MQEYAIVDIETTGGNAQSSAITEIAIIIYNGSKVVKRWETLINPQKEIPFNITVLTGITNSMVSSAPVFDEVAHQIYDLLHNRIFVAHNVNFDYSFIHFQLQQAGLNWFARKLCTVRAARKILPGQPTYSLGKLCKALGIPHENHHRAGGDADATLILLKQLLQNDTHKEIDQLLKRRVPQQNLPPNLAVEEFEQLPEKPGVYYFYNKEHKVVYIGKAVNIKKRVASHFSGNKTTEQRQLFLKDIYHISFEVCGNELLALLLECSEIQKLWPIHNKALKRFEPKFGLYSYEARSGYLYLTVGKLAKHQSCDQVFHSVQEGNEMLRNLSEQFAIDYRFCKYATYQQETVFGASHVENDLPIAELHNKSIQEALHFVSQQKASFFIIEKVRTINEYSCVWVENGQFFGMGYLSKEIPVTNAMQIKDTLIRYKSNQYLMQLIMGYAAKNPQKVHQVSVIEQED